MTIDRHLLAIIGKRLPAIYDVIPHGPQQGLAFTNRLSEVALNPQPLPPAGIGAALAAEFARTAWLADRSGAAKAFAELDDWCPTSPKKLRLPPWWPPIPEPEPHPEWFTDLQIGFVTRLAVAAVQYEGSALGAVLDKAIDRSVASMRPAGSRS